MRSRALPRAIARQLAVLYTWGMAQRPLFKSPLLVFHETARGLMLVPTKLGVEEARELLGRNNPIWALSEMLEYAMGNGWDFVPPEDIGALTDAPIISQDGFVDDDGHWKPSGPDAKVFAHMDYQVENPVETWASGNGVFFVRG